MRSLRLLPAVLQDVAEAAAWYDREGYPGLGDRFVETFYASLPNLQENAMVSAMVYLGYRKILLRPFPYAVYYRLHENTWVVTLVIHAARRPTLARSLLRERK